MESNFKYIQFFKSIPCPSVILKVNNNGFEIVDANDAYSRLCTLSIADMKGKEFFELFPINPYIYPDIWSDSFESVLKEKKAINLGVRKLVSPLNSHTTFLDIRHYEIHHLPIFDTEGRIEYIVRSLTDVTQQVIQEELYNESQTSAQYGNWWLNSEQNTMEWSTGFKDILEISHDFQPSIESARQFYHCAEEEASFYKSVDEAIENKTMFKTVLSIITANGNQRWLLLIGKPIIVEDICVGMRGVAKDITEKLAYIDQIENQHNNLRDIAFAQSHLVRAPLARILALVQHLKQEYNEGPSETTLLDALNHSAKELDLVIHDIIRKTAPEEMLR
ncbi:PAS domain-containing protein [Sphingobacterium nematocida]|uniref:PAS domain-containing protein n=1 Tax=Sphingobacterium nematocida TaxID=1513896 RepID=A0A1T5FI02_9SPHI|nr:PAS domain-containing protein [Sphingobacterium nematocida]SKB95716.1 PAS domain-containing protein [Sphingobacterium nematocida]